MTHGTLLRGADILARTLEQIGVDRVFSVSGNHIMPVYDALTETSIELIHCRHEAACVHMADAYARITGQVGIALVTGGPGHTNAAAALYTALAAEAPMLLLSGHASTKELGRGAFQELRQAEMVRPITKAAWTLEASFAIGHEVARAAQIARSGRGGPVHLSLPVDLLEERHEDRAELWPTPAAAERVPVPLVKSALDAIGASLARAERPIFVCGPTLAVAGRNRMAALEEVTAAPVIAMESPRGINDPALGALPDVLARSDLIVLIGKPLDFTLRFGD